MVEQESHKLLEVGSIPTRPTGKKQGLSVFTPPAEGQLTTPLTGAAALPGRNLPPEDGTSAAADPDLARVALAWPDLPAHIKAAVLALVEAGRPR